MIFSILFAIPIFLSLVYFTNSGSKSPNINQRTLMDQDYYIKKEQFEKYIQNHISQQIPLLEQQNITINYQCIDQWFLRVNLTHLNLHNIQYDVEQIKVQLVNFENLIFIMLSIQQFDLIVHFEFWNIYENQTQFLTLPFRVQDTQMKLGFKINIQKIQYMDDWFPKLQFGSFEILLDLEVQKYKKLKIIIDWLLEKFHQSIQNLIVQYMMKSLNLDQLNTDIQFNNEIKQVKNLKILDPQTLQITIQKYSDQNFQIGQIFG